MKDPAFLFYSNDFLAGTMLLNDEEVGQYIKLLCLQHQKGHLKEKDMLLICKTKNDNIFSKFIQDENGNYYNVRLEEEANKRKAYAESRRNNRRKKDDKAEEEKRYEKDMKKICNTYEKDMENENINENININNNINNNINKDITEIVKYYEQNIGLITPAILEKIEDYLNDMDKDLILKAIEIATLKNKRNYNYIQGILNRWCREGIKIISQLEEKDNKNINKNREVELDELRKLL